MEVINTIYGWLYIAASVAVIIAVIASPFVAVSYFIKHRKEYDPKVVTICVLIFIVLCLIPLAYLALKG